MGNIPNDNDMKKFWSELVEMGYAEAHRKLNQGIYASTWKSREAQRFVDERKFEESIRVAKRANWISIGSLVIAAVAVLVACIR